MIGKTEIIKLLNIIDEAHEYTDGGLRRINQKFVLMDLGEQNEDSLSINAAWRWFNHMREVKRDLNITRGLGHKIPIIIGDFISASSTSYSGIITAEGLLGDIPVWKVRGPRDEIGIILKSQAVFIAPDWEGEITGVPLI